MFQGQLIKHFDESCHMAPSFMMFGAIIEAKKCKVVGYLTLRKRFLLSLLRKVLKFIWKNLGKFFGKFSHKQKSYSYNILRALLFEKLQDCYEKNTKTETFG